VKNLNKKRIVVYTIVIIALLYLPTIFAQPDNITIWTDKPRYAPGETGTLSIAFYNDRTVAVTLKNITVIYSNWRAYSDGLWIGNETQVIDQPIAAGKTHVLQITFTVPTDGRGDNSYVSVEIWTDYGRYMGSGYIYVPETPTFMEQIVTLFTVMVVLLIVCTVIISATIFLSARRPQTTWKAPEKTE
jgi:hypothetical protein